MSENKGQAQGIYEHLIADRQRFLSRARACAEVTIPALSPPDGYRNNGEDLPQPHQSVGAMGVNTLSSKLLMSLIPTNQPFFKLEVTDPDVLEIVRENKDAEAKIEAGLAGFERESMRWMQRRNLRVSTANILRLLITTGNAAIVYAEGSFKVFRLDSYVCSRSPDGTILEFITKEIISFGALDEDIQELLRVKSGATEKTIKDDTEYDLYTRFYLRDGRYHTYQEIDDCEIPGTKGSYAPDDIPFIVLRWSSLEGEDYGRGHVEEYIGDLNSLEDLSQSIVETSLACAKTIFLVKPGAALDVQDLIEAENLDVLEGKEGDVTVISVEKARELTVAKQQAADLEQRLARAFLMNGSVQRDAERVTAEEIRLMAVELEDALGGVYSLLAAEFQLPLVRLVMNEMKSEGSLPDLPEGVVEPAITTGLEALGRGHELNKLMAFAQMMQQLFGPEETVRRLKPGVTAIRVATALGFDAEDLIKSDEEYQAERAEEARQMQQQMAADAMKGAVPHVAKAAMDNQAA